MQIKVTLCQCVAKNNLPNEDSGLKLLSLINRTERSVSTLSSNNTEQRLKEVIIITSVGDGILSEFFDLLFSSVKPPYFVSKLLVMSPRYFYTQI